MTIVEILTEAFIVASLALALKLAPTVLLTSLGEIVAEKSGVLNLGVEGFMLVGALVAFAATFVTGNPVFGALAAMGAALVLGLIFALFAVNLRLNQVVLGLGFWLFGWGLADTLYRAFFVAGGITPTVPILGTVKIPLLSEIPVLGRVLFSQNPFVYLSLLLMPLISFFLNKTSLGLRIRAVGENPRAAETMGVNVNKTRYIAVLIGAALAGLGGAYFTVSYLSTYFPNVTAGRGFIALAIIYFGKWNPYRTFIPVLIFNLVDSFQLQLVIVGIPIKYFFMNMFPYIAVVALIPILGRRAVAPAALMQPYKKGG